MDKIEISKKTKETLKKCYVITTENVLDEENIKLKEAIKEVLDKTMTSRERSEWGYEYYLEHKQYNKDLEANRKTLKEWANILKGSGNANYSYAYAIDRVNDEIDKLNKVIDKMAEHIVNSAVVDDTVCCLKIGCEDKECNYEEMLSCTKKYFIEEVENE